MCNVSQIIIDVEKREGGLILPDMNYPDMSSTIKCFTSVDPEINVIQTLVGGKPDVAYVKSGDKWEAKYGRLS